MVGDVLFSSFEALAVPLVVSDPERDDNPVVFANSAFSRLTGYSAAEAVGRNCRFMQGPDTEPDAVREIRERLAQRRPLKTRLINYRKDGTAFRNELNIGPVFDEHGSLIYYVGAMLPCEGDAGESVAQTIQRLLAGMDAAGLGGPAADDARQSLRTLQSHLEGAGVTSDGRPGG